MQMKNYEWNNNQVTRKNNKAHPEVDSIQFKKEKSSLTSQGMDVLSKRQLKNKTKHYIAQK